MFPFHVSNSLLFMVDIQAVTRYIKEKKYKKIEKLSFLTPCRGGEKRAKFTPKKNSRKQFFLNCLTKKRLCGIMSMGENSDISFGMFRSFRLVRFVRRPQLTVHMREGRRTKKAPRKHSQKNDPVRGQKKGSEKVKKSDFFTPSEKSIFYTFRAMQKSQKKEFLNATFLFKKIYFSAKKMHKKI